MAACRLDSETRIIRIESDTGHQGVMTLPIRVGDDAKKSRVINVPAEPGKMGVSTLPIAVNELDQKRPTVCLQPKQTGPCRGFNTKFFFDSTKEKCVAFNYGGCDVCFVLKSNIRLLFTFESFSSLGERKPIRHVGRMP